MRSTEANREIVKTQAPLLLHQIRIRAQVPNANGEKMAFLEVADSDAQEFILVMMTVTGTIAVVEKLAGVSQSAQSVGYINIFVGVGVATLLLELLSYALPQFASGLAILAVLTMIVTKGAPFWNIVGTVVSGSGTSNAQNAASPPATVATMQSPNTTTAGGRG